VRLAPLRLRFSACSSLGTRDDLNLYAYTYNDPLNATDPTGETLEEIIVTAGRFRPVPLPPVFFGLGAASLVEPTPFGEALVGLGAGLYQAYKFGQYLAEEADSSSDQGKSSEEQPSEQDLVPLKDNEKANEAARAAGYRDAHDAKKGRGSSKVDIYRDKRTGKHWIWDGTGGSSKDQL
jgi:hypothetical protein